MQVDISVPGTFHAFRLGRQLEDRQCLRKIYTTYPKFATNTEDLPDGKVTHIRHPELIAQIGHRFPVLNDVFPSWWAESLNRWKGQLFDKSVARKLESVENGIFLGFAGVSLKSLERANELGLTTVVERSSSHIRTQKEILDEEYQKYNWGESPISNRHIKHEEQEYQEANYIVTPSKFAQESFLKRGYSKEKVKRIPLGVDPPDCRQISDGSDGEKMYFIYSGAVTLRKGIQYLLHAWDSLDLPDAELIVTSNIDESAQPIIEEYKSRNDIHFVGWVDDLYEWFGKSSVFVFPSLEDGFGMVVIEAMASGLPVIVSENTGAKDCVREGVDGHVVPIRDESALADAMCRMYNNPDERDRMGRAAREHIQLGYTEDNYGERIFSLYQMLAKS